MKTKKHTPGPWKAYKRDEPVGHAEYEIHFSSDGECVAEVVHEAADAHLMAAAPELLEVLEMVSGLPDFKNFWSSTQQKIENAIQKAYGR